MKGELQHIVSRLIERLGSLRAAERITEISHSGLAQIRDGKTIDPKPATLQKLAIALQQLEPPLLDGQGKAIRPSWIELQLLADQDKQYQQPNRQEMLSKIEDLEAELAQLRSQLGLSVA